MNNFSKVDFYNFFDLKNSPPCLKTESLLDTFNFSYRELTTNELQKVLLENLKVIEAGDLNYSGEHRKLQWDKGWNQNLELIQKSPKDRNQLKPLYYRPNHIIRLGDKYIYSDSDDFEFNVFQLIRSYLFNNYIQNSGCKKLFEFGCGPAHNLVYFYDCNPKIHYFGLDWAQSSQRIIEVINKNLNSSITGLRYDFFKPEHNLPLDQDSIVITFGALEQTGDQWHNLVSYWIRSKPKLIINIEPISELYDSNSLIDHLGLLYHRKRKYLNGFLTFLKNLHDSKLINSLKVKKGCVGGRYMNGWNIIIWKP